MRKTARGPRTFWRALCVLAVALAPAAALTGCNTTEGVGRDVKSLGKGIEETAQDSKN